MRISASLSAVHWWLRSPMGSAAALADFRQDGSYYKYLIWCLCSPSGSQTIGNSEHNYGTDGVHYCYFGGKMVV